MSTHYVIVTDINNSRNDFASLDFTSDPACPVTAAVLLPAGSVDQTIQMNADNFSSTNDLFTISNGGTVLVGARTLNPALPSKAVLRQKKLVMTVPADGESLGLSFGFPLNDVGTGAFLLIGNPNGAQADGAIVYGDSLGPLGAIVAVPSLGTQTIAIPNGTAKTRVNLNISNGVKVLLQVLINGKGQEFSMTIALPIN